MKIHRATAQFEQWMRTQTILVPADLRVKHRQMAAAMFPFLRATFYRWMQLWPEVCNDMVAAPKVLAVGDLHIENFGTWRDAEGRLIWGINDFDEAFPLPYTIDLVRLASSARVAAQEEHLALRPRAACNAILEGYRTALEGGGKAFVLEEHHRWLRDIALNELRDPVMFWKKMDSLPDLKASVPEEARRGLQEMMPKQCVNHRRKHRIAGLGSLGRQRIVMLADWRGGLVAREAKALLPSACIWAARLKVAPRIWYGEIIGRAVRVLDPFVCLRGNWLLRRLAPDCSRIELASLPKYRDELALLHSMGWETANVHLGSRKAIPAVLRDLRGRKARWLHDAAKKMAKALAADWKDWRKNGRDG